MCRGARRCAQMWGCERSQGTATWAAEHGQRCNYVGDGELLPGVVVEEEEEERGEEEEEEEQSLPQCPH